ncbi:MAG: cytochrome c family protein [Kordiimonadaceae bacterium]|nr:cytochrome c family protein [Kordiimonadaceae bacterium]MBT6036174.1 cytochrome c family protein [Kordiimonadaceae bacterium]MBT6330967.1 cytochrome c family protein [Kordiimonadaceae bacterium]MBT7583208.1 cytochrome c family protein [Kordiimonadaceae bacterium]
MNSHDFNKAAMGVLMFLLLAIGLHNLTEAVFHQEAMAANAFPIDVSAVASASVADVAMEVGPTIEELMQTANIDKGMTVFKKCAACHTPESGGRAKIGPNLWNVLGGDIATNGDFGYSNAMLAQEGNWTYEFLNTYLTKPKDAIPKNKMVFAGLKKGSDRASVILYLRSLSDAPIDLPVVATVEAVEAVVEAMPDTM